MFLDSPPPPRTLLIAIPLRHRMVDGLFKSDIAPYPAFSRVLKVVLYMTNDGKEYLIRLFSTDHP